MNSTEERTALPQQWPPIPSGYVSVGIARGQKADGERKYPILTPIDPKAVRADPKSWRGPTDYSNWVIPGRVLAGGYPGNGLDTEKHRLTVESLLKAGVNTFLCLQLTNELRRFRPYRDEALEMWNKMQEEVKDEVGCQEKRLQFLHFPIPDQYVVEDEKVIALIDELEKRFHDGEVIYIHCWGGHGRTGTIVACLLARLHGFTGPEGAEKALDLTSALHCTRAIKKGARSPQHPIQYTQVRRLVTGPIPTPSASETTSVDVLDV